MSAIVRSKGVMPSLQCERSAILLCGIVLALASTIYAQSVVTNGGEYILSGRRAGDQTQPEIAIRPTGGYMVWQDNAVDGPGKSIGIAARRLGSQMEPLIPVFRVNQIVAGLQQNPRVAMMTNGGAAFVWQGGKLGMQDIYFRTYWPTSALGGILRPQKDLVINSYTNGQQGSPVITCLSNGNLAVAWCTQDKSMEGVLARVVTPTGAFVGAPFRVNQVTSYNQRSPAITTLSNGNFIVAWISANQGVSALEVLHHTNRTHIYARVYTQAGYPVSDEFRINTHSNICASPSVTQWGDGGFTVTWAERTDSRSNGWDIYARTFAAFNAPVTDAIRVNEVTYGDQFVPRIASLGSEQLVVWNSFGQDGSREGVFGRALHAGALNGPEFRVNTQTNGSQIQPQVAANRADQFLAVWSTYEGGSSFDVHGQRYFVTQATPITPSPGYGNEGSTPGAPLPPPPLLPPTPVGGSQTQTNSTIPSRILRVGIDVTNKGRRLTWNTDLGAIYQVQYSTNFTRWDNVGEPRTATASSDWTPVGHLDSAGFYRVIRVQ